MKRRTKHKRFRKNIDIFVNGIVKCKQIFESDVEWVVNIAYVNKFFCSRKSIPFTHLVERK